MIAQPVKIYDTLEGLLKNSVIGAEIPTLYFDTNVLLDIIDKRDSNSVALYRYAWQNKWRCITSIFAKVEVLEVKQNDRFKIEKQKFGLSGKKKHKRDLCPRILGNISSSLTKLLKSRCEGFNEYSFIVEGGWLKAEEVKRKTNLTDKDSIHLAEALAFPCDLFITRDIPLLSIAKKYMWAERPNFIIKILRSVGAKI